MYPQQGHQIEKEQRVCLGASVYACACVCVCEREMQGMGCGELVLRAQNEDFTYDHGPQDPTPADGAVGTSLKEARL